MDLYADLTLSGTYVMGERAEYRLKLDLWAEARDEDDEVYGLRLKKLGRVYRDAGKAEAALAQLETALGALQIEIKPLPHLSHGRVGQLGMGV